MLFNHKITVSRGSSTDQEWICGGSIEGQENDTTSEIPVSLQ